MLINNIEQIVQRIFFDNLPVKKYHIFFQNQQGTCTQSDEAIIVISISISLQSKNILLL